MTNPSSLKDICRGTLFAAVACRRADSDSDLDLDVRRIELTRNGRQAAVLLAPPPLSVQVWLG
jgi:hypothetical protein